MEYGVTHGLQSSNNYKKSSNFPKTFGSLEPKYDPISYTDTLLIIMLSLGHSIVYGPMRKLIQSKGDMTSMPKV